MRLTTVADELQEMAHSSRSAPVSQLARQGADQLHQLASWLKDHQADDLLEEARAFARRRPGVFLLGAALAGVVAGRLTGVGVAALRQSHDTGSTSERSARPRPQPHLNASSAVTGPPPVPTPAAGGKRNPAPRPPVQGTYPETSSGQAGSGTAYLAPPTPQPLISSTPHSQPPRGAPAVGGPPYSTNRDAGTGFDHRDR